MRDLEALIQERIASLLFSNPNRINHYEQYQKIIEAYNQEQDRSAIEKTFMDLMDLASSMSQEQQRYVREGFSSDEELSVYDMLFRDDLSKADIKKIKEVAVSLLAKVKEKIAQLDHWTDKQETRAMVDVSYEIRSPEFPKYRGVDTMCAVGANGCIVGASMGAYKTL